MNQFYLLLFYLFYISDSHKIFPNEIPLNLKRYIRIASAIVCLETTVPSFISAKEAATEINSILPTNKEGCITDSNPQTTTKLCRRLGLLQGRLRGCDANENCFSTSAKAASKYDSPWSYGFLVERESNYDPWSSLLAAIEKEGLKVLKADKTKNYILAAEKDVPNQPKGSSLFYEFLVKHNIGHKLVLYRAVVDKTVFVYPLQQPVSDFGALKNRLQGVLSRTGWLKIGE